MYLLLFLNRTLAREGSQKLLRPAPRSMEAATFTLVMIRCSSSCRLERHYWEDCREMGFMMVGLGAGMTAPGSWPVALTAVTVYAAHHAFAKGALFLGVGVAERVEDHAGLWRTLVIAGLVLCSLAIAGAP